jgi:tetratricopeptide (TPR) repeat protein/thiol-disulfide isomerase/thioredoxin
MSTSLRGPSPLARAAAFALLTATSPAVAAGTAPRMTVPFLTGRPFAEALRTATAEKKHVLVDVYAVWCGPCKLMDRTTFSDPAVGAWVGANFVAVKMDAERGEGRRLAQRYMVTSFPTILFLDAKGNELDRLTAVYPPEAFLTTGRNILAGKTPLLEALAGLRKTWAPREAAALAQELVRRNDVARLRPIVLRLVSEEDDLGSPEATLHLLALLAALEDFQGHLSPETADLVATFLPRAGIDVRRGALALALAHEQVRRGETAAARATVKKTFEAIGEKGPYTAELYAALGSAERRAGRWDAAIAAFRKALAVSEATGIAPAARGEHQMDLADALAAAGRRAEAKTALAAALETWGNESDAWVRASKVALALKESSEAAEHARRAVALSNGESAAAQAALGAALAATGDTAGSAAAWKRAAELDPGNPDYRRAAAAPAKPTAAGPS